MASKPRRPAERAAQQILERRQAERQPAEGEVVLLIEGPEALEIRGRLMDISAHGFRAVHHEPKLQAGQRVVFRHPYAQGAARVVWNRRFGGCIESGLLVLVE